MLFSRSRGSSLYLFPAIQSKNDSKVLAFIVVSLASEAVTTRHHGFWVEVFFERRCETLWLLPRGIIFFFFRAFEQNGEKKAKRLLATRLFFWFIFKRKVTSRKRMRCSPRGSFFPKADSERSPLGARRREESRCVSSQRDDVDDT